MKVLEQASSRLSLSASSKGVRIFGGLLLVGGIFIKGVLPSKVTQSLNCDRNEGTCQIVRVGQLGGGDGNKSFPASELQGAEIKTDARVDSNGHEHVSYDLMIITRSYEDVFFISKLDKDDLIGITSQINNFVKNPAQPFLKLTNEDDISQLTNPISIGAVLLGLLAILQDEVTYTFDKSSKILFIKRQGLRGNRISSEPISNISDVQVKQNVVKNPQNGKLYYSYTLNLLMSSGKILTLISSGGSSECNTIANDIKKMLSLRL